MITKNFTLATLLLIPFFFFAQAPQKMSFQAVMRNSNNAVIAKCLIGLRISIIQGSDSGTPVYTETQQTTSDFNGLVSLEVGAGTNTTGNFASIDWGKGPYFIKTEADPIGGNDYSIIGASQLLSVPYALWANNGPTGLTGPAGATGPMGLPGLAGAVGLEGPMGLRGFSGLNGLPGAAGLAGADGSAGLAGATGTAGADGAVGLPGAIGPAGIAGLAGAQGAAGLDGLAGTAGLNGAAGLAGTNGLPGAAGLAGATGTAGLNGAAGLAGTNGLPGAAGLAGATGPAGLDGAAGLAGTNGLAGAAGLAGATGLDGTNGLPGAAGLAGATGPAGLNGTNGTNAVNGEPTVALGTTAQYYRGDKSWQTLNSAAVGLANVDNTSDANKPVSTAAQTALELKSNLISPAFTGTPLAPTATEGTNTTQLATTAFVLANSNQHISVSAGTEISTNSVSDVIASGLSLAPTTGINLLQFNAQFTIDPVNTVQAGTDLDAAYATLMAKTVTNSTHSVTYGGETLTPGVYTNTAAVTANGTLTLSGAGDYIFRFGGAFSTGASFNLVLTGGASACNVYWIAEGAIALGAGTNMKGTLIAHSGAVTVGSLSTINGSLFSTTGAIGLDATTISVLSGCANVIGNLAHFALYTKAGNLTNVGPSVITGDIATNSGTITGFSAATINGISYTSGMTPSLATFSYYQNGTLIPFSSRSISASTSLTSSINLQSVSSLTTGDTVDVRWKINSGTVKMTNRNFTALRVR